MSEVVRFGVIGTGFGAHHVEVLRQTPGAEVVGIASAQPARAAALAVRVGIPLAAGDYRQLLPRVDEYEELLTGNRIWQQRLVNVGVLTAEDCKAYGVTGPMIRASGVKWDLRKAQPYSGYETYDFEIPTRTNGDSFDRYMVRIEEMRQSARIVRQGVARLEAGPIMAKVPKVIKPPVGEAYVSIEAPKGELGYYIVSDGSTQPYRLRVRPPSFVNLQSLDKMARGGLVADLVAVIGTIDIVLGEVDR